MTADHGDYAQPLALAERIADYVETAHMYDQWTKRQAMVEAVRVAVEDARYDTERVLAAINSGHQR